MKLRVLFGIFLILTLTACFASTQTIVSDKVIFYGEGEYWNVSYIYNSELYEEKMVSWIEMEAKGFEISQEEIDNIDIEFDSRDGLITGNVGDMETSIEGNVITFLVGTVNFETYEEDQYTFTVKFKDNQDVIKLQIKR
ncbi:hypothetical protein [Bacillus alkalicellulosilyticus]|uniref:hypothetical protein n=1 Tax=Alkalihalobacterium alkalicellulosilyticum TaxID=1912214 RepID=UPI0009983A3F|nr:hypothetical protein [Bacillus alkalicellulosilyticus]